MGYNSILKDKLVSIIVPVYNIDTYIASCLNSILNQTYKNIEVIIINDGSTDKTSSICKKYALNDSRIILINQDNAGVSMARNRGLSLAKGEYLTFIDGDDYVYETYIEKLIVNAIDNLADISVLSYLEKWQKKDIQYGGTGNIIVYNNQEALEDFLTEKNIKQSICCKLYKKEIYEAHRFRTDMKVAEDKYYNLETFMASNVICYEDSCEYVYRMRTGSAVKGSFSFKNIDAVNIMEQAKDRVLKTYPTLKKEAEKMYYIECFNVLKSYAVCNYKMEYEEYIKNYVSSIKHANFKEQYTIMNSKERLYMILLKISPVFFITYNQIIIKVKKLIR